MKLTIQKSFQFVVDTERERERIKKAFKTRKETRDKLNKLMDLIEEGEWQKAKEEVESEWWEGDDEKDECPRREFIGLIHANNINIDSSASYELLIYAMVEHPEWFTLIRKD